MTAVADSPVHTHRRIFDQFLLECDSPYSVKGRFIGLFQHCGRSACCILTLNKFPHSSPEVPCIIQMHETSTSEGGNYYQ